MREKLFDVIAELFKVEVQQLSDDTGPGDLPAWDSLGHVALMARIQERFGTHIPVEDAIEVESIADLLEILERLTGEAK
ncbi:MAG: acyl carrier protein [Planctomycetales bacterium]|nr:acyl carrier protein [Planctomycetales bacterium]